VPDVHLRRREVGPYRAAAADVHVKHHVPFLGCSRARVAGCPV
jgi:hypothetical protein